MCWWLVLAVLVDKISVVAAVVAAACFTRRVSRLP
jgi:hypothetical protein